MPKRRSVVPQQSFEFLLTNKLRKLFFEKLLENHLAKKLKLKLVQNHPQVV